METTDPLHVRVGEMFLTWRHRLKLLDWDVSWKIVRKEDLPEHRSGRCDFVLMKKVAVIQIIHPDDADKNWIDPFDMELTIVHELLHLHLAPWSLLFEQGDQALIFLEQTVHALSSSFIAADRGNRHWKNLPEMCSVQDTRCVVR